MRNSESILQVGQNNAVGSKASSPSFLAGVLALAGGAVIAQGIGFVTSPIICRIFSPDTFGLEGIFRSFVTIIGILTCLRYELAIMLPKREEDTATLFVFCFVLIFIITGLVVIGVAFLGPALMRTLEVEELIPYLWLVPVCVFLVGLALPFRTWSNRQQQYKYLSLSRIFSSASKNFTLISGGFLGYRTVITLIACYVLEMTVASLTLFRHVVYRDLPVILKNFNFRRMLPLARRYIKFPLITSASTLLNTSVYQIPVFLFAYYLGKTVVGYYSRCLLLLGMPLTLISGAIAQVFFQRVTEWKNNGRAVENLIEGVLLRLLYMTIMPFLLIAFFGKDIYTILLGNQWSEAGIYAGILAPRYFFLAISTSLMTTFAAYEKQGHELFFNVLLTIFTISAIVLGGSVFNNARLTIALFSLAGIIVYIIRLMYILYLSEASLNRIIRQLLPYIFYIVPLLTATAVARWWLFFSLPLFFIVILIVLFTYYILALQRDAYLKGALYLLMKQTISGNKT